MKTAKLTSLSILIPAYNDDKTIKEVVQQAYQIGKKYTKKLEIIICDDGSSDGTLKMIGNMLKDIPLRLIKHQRNLGYGQTIKELYLTAANDFVFTIPGDRQIRADVLAILLRKIDKLDLVVGMRKKRQDSFWRRGQSIIYNNLLKYLGKVSIHDVNSSKLLKKNILDKITLDYESAFVDAELCLKAQRRGFQVGEVMIPHYSDRHRKGGGASLKTVLPTIRDFLFFLVRKN